MKKYQVFLLIGIIISLIVTVFLMLFSFKLIDYGTSEEYRLKLIQAYTTGLQFDDGFTPEEHAQIMQMGYLIEGVIGIVISILSCISIILSSISIFVSKKALFILTIIFGFPFGSVFSGIGGIMGIIYMNENKIETNTKNIYY